jgi:superkiller protein 3
MGILTEDDSLVDAALSEILELPLDRRRVRDPRRDANYITVQQYLEQVRLI